VLKLYGSNGSPFTRKARVFIGEAGLWDRVEYVLVPPNEFRTVMPKHSPLGKVPVLELDDGTKMIDSPAICEYLDSLHSGRKLFPDNPDERWKALRYLALGDGICEAVIAAFRELYRPKDKQNAAIVDRESKRAANCVDLLDREIDELTAGPVTIGQIAAAVGVGHIVFRKQTGELPEHPALDLATRTPRLLAWYDAFFQRPSMQNAKPEK
jgi:glutathione S-transferase